MEPFALKQRFVRAGRAVTVEVGVGAGRASRELRDVPREKGDSCFAQSRVRTELVLIGFGGGKVRKHLL